MTRDWEATFKNWAQPPGKTEQAKCNNAVQVIRNAIDKSPNLNQRSTTVFPQGSYRNRTNVRTESDVDICVLCTDTFFYKLPDGVEPDDFGIIPSSYSYFDYKNDVEDALVTYLGWEAVTRGNKAFDVHENTYRVDADVVACFEYRRYRRNGNYTKGVAFNTDQKRRIVNWPEQNYENGVTKNNATGRRFKALVRILKQLRNEMADTTPSYLIESLVWNVHNIGFGNETYTADVRYALAHLWDNTRSFDNCKEWGEINELKYLFRDSQPWTREQANTFLYDAWNYVGFE